MTLLLLHIWLISGIATYLTLVDYPYYTTITDRFCEFAAFLCVWPLFIAMNIME